MSAYTVNRQPVRSYGYENDPQFDEPDYGPNFHQLRAIAAETGLRESVCQEVYGVLYPDEERAEKVLRACGRLNRMDVEIDPVKYAKGLL